MVLMNSRVLNMNSWRNACQIKAMCSYSGTILLPRSRVNAAFYHCTGSLMERGNGTFAKPERGIEQSGSTGKPNCNAWQKDMNSERSKSSQRKGRGVNVQQINSSKMCRGEYPVPRKEFVVQKFTKVSAELQKLSLEDSKQWEITKRTTKDSKEGHNDEIVFGVSPCLLALTQGRRKFIKLFVKEGEATQRPAVRQVCKEAERLGVQVQRVSKKELDRMASTQVHQGLCLQASPLGYILNDGVSKAPNKNSDKTPIWLVLDGVQDPMNLGAVLRSAYFLGVDRVVSSLRNSCPLTPVVSKASSGVMEIMGVYGYENLADLLKLKKNDGWQVVGTVGAEAASSPVPVIQCSDFQMTKPTLLLMGGEGKGLSLELFQQCHLLLTIPSQKNLHPGVDSLNISVATGILLYSILSSRGKLPSSSVVI